MAMKPRKTAQSRPKSKRGGKRPGSGRKAADLTRLRAEFHKVAHGLIVDRLPDLIGNLVKLANGGYERVEVEQTPADVVMAADLNVPVGQLVVTRRKVATAEPDREANKYLVDRVLGRPRQSVELSGPDGAAIPVSIERAIAKIYGGPGTAPEDET